jgi:hypothetical protein
VPDTAGAGGGTYCASAAPRKAAGNKKRGTVGGGVLREAAEKCAIAWDRYRRASMSSLAFSSHADINRSPICRGEAEVANRKARCNRKTTDIRCSEFRNDPERLIA